jgi:hypothetical protein
VIELPNLESMKAIHSQMQTELAETCRRGTKKKAFASKERPRIKPSPPKRRSNHEIYKIGE